MIFHGVRVKFFALRFTPMRKNGPGAPMAVSFVAAIVISTAVALVAAAPAPPAGRAAREGAATENRHATDAALSILRAGGTAADAAVAGALAAGVASPSSSGLGGGGFALVLSASDGKVTVLDFRETAPATLDTEAFERRPLPAAERGKLVGVPGEPAGLFELSRRFGKRPWRELVAPALRLARDGFSVEPHLGSVLASSSSAAFRRMAAIDRLYYPAGKPLGIGARVKHPKLEKTLGRLGNEGPRPFYEGPIAADLVAAARSAGGTLTAADLAAYRFRELRPLRVAWESYEVFTMPPPSGGGVFLAEVLGSFTRAEIVEMGPNTPLSTHRIADVMRGALADRALYVADPEALPIDVTSLLDPKRLHARKARLHPEKTHAVRAFIGEEHGTQCLITADAHGNVVVLSSTVNTAFGAELEGEMSGIVLNDELDDFTSLKTASSLGVRHPPNRPRPGVRPTSNMTPTLVLEGGRPVLAIGGSGGSTIPANVTEVLIEVLAHGTPPDRAVAKPRFRPESRDGQTLSLDPGFSPSFVADLERRGELVRQTSPNNAVQLLSWSKAGLLGAADPRKAGVARVR
jgi:gamma-glutamyltranspeptidase/glutathione hydrolase